MTLLIRSWFIARWLGVTDKPDDDDREFIPVRLEAGGPTLWWAVQPKSMEEV
jgi:hypothetical protein